MKQQVVDPFVVAAPRLTRLSRRPAAMAPKPAPSGIASKVRPRPVGGIDGMLPVRSVPKQKLTAALTHAYRPPAGPLHLKYQTHQKHQVRPAQAVGEPVKPVGGHLVSHVPSASLRPAPARPSEQTALPRPSAQQSPKPSVKLRQRQSMLEKMKPRMKTSPAVAQSGRKISTWAVAGVAAIGGLALFSVEVGQLALLGYAIAAIWRRWPSQQTFALALAMFGGIIITSLLASLMESIRYIAENLAVYAFLLLCIGTASLALEVRRDTRQASVSR